MLTAEERAKKNRANAQKSTGPKTPEGIERSAKNSVKHGQRAKVLKNFIPPHAAVLCNQDRQRYFRLHEKLIAKYRPHDAAEAAVVKKIADAEWRALMIDELFTAFHNKQVMDKKEGRHENNPEIAELLLDLAVFQDNVDHPGVYLLHERVRKGIDRTIAANEKRLILLRKHFPSESTAIERRDFDREKREFYRSNPELFEWRPDEGSKDGEVCNDDEVRKPDEVSKERQPANEATFSGPLEEAENFQLPEQ